MMQDIETARILDNDKYDVDTFDLKLNVGTEEVPSRYTRTRQNPNTARN